jgi:DNA-binding CsgD family transcriptional regulator
MGSLTRQHLERALDFVLEASAIDDPDRFVRHAVDRLPSLVASEITTLSICDLVGGTRRVISYPGNAIAAPEQAIFNQLIHGHPLVQFHSRHPGGGSWRVSDSMPLTAFRRTAIFGEYYSRIGIDHVSFVLNRRGRDFSERDRDLLDRIRPSLANVYRLAAARERLGNLSEAARLETLTARENEVLDWVAAGKSDRQVARLIGASPRTVQKHLEHVYTKLGVENRTAAVMRRLQQRKA